MLLEDFFDALDFRSFGVPPAEKWVDALAAEADAAGLLATLPGG